MHQLMKAQCLIINRQKQEAEWILDDFKREWFDRKSPVWGYYLYIMTLIEREPKYVDRLTKEIEVIFHENPDSVMLFWILSFLQEQYFNNIKLLEDKMNADNDVLDVGVQMILLVEDSVRFYSSVLPHVYKFLLTQSKEFSTEALNEHEQMLRMRGRPKIVLARTYEEAMHLYNRYEKNVLGVITDARYPRECVVDPLAGIRLMEEIRKRDPFMPLILQSSEVDNKRYARQYEAGFVDKNSKKMNVDLRDIVSDSFGFGDLLKDAKIREEVMAMGAVGYRQIFLHAKEYLTLEDWYKWYELDPKTAMKFHSVMKVPKKWLLKHGYIKYALGLG